MIEIKKRTNPNSLDMTLEITPMDSIGNEIFHRTVDKASDELAKMCIEKWGDEIMANIDKQDIINACKVHVAKKIYSELTDLQARSAPFAKSLPSITETQMGKINSILNS